MIGDGSGTTWDLPCGWGAATFTRHSFEPILTWGTFSHGSNIAAELMAYLQPLIMMTLGHKETHQLDRGPDGQCIVHIVTDCEYVVKAGNREQSRDKNASLWSLLDYFRMQLIDIRFHHVTREVLVANRFSHHMGNLVRKACLRQEAQAIALAGVDSAFRLATGQGSLKRQKRQ